VSTRTRLALALATAVLVLAGSASTARTDDDDEPVHSDLPLRLQPLPEETRRVRLETMTDGSSRFVLEKLDGSEERLDPVAFAARLEADTHHHHHWGFKLLNITSHAGIAWVALGLLGQLLFTGRMVLQWLVSERSRRSVVPVAFWWMSVGGASMLLAYFIWRRDVVGVLGQAAGWVIYLRNLRLIYRERRTTGQGSSRSAAVA
jgi:lipid-A-disaccharide synthase-like uncharacterized protein